MDIDWTQVRGALARIERELAKTQKVVESAEADIVRDWPEVRREEIEAAFPGWRTEYGPSWLHDFMEKRIGKRNYCALPGNRRYKISPEAYRALNLPARVPPGRE